VTNSKLLRAALKGGTALSTALILGGLTVATPAFAQETTNPGAAPPTGPAEAVAPDATPTSTAAGSDEEIIVTGSRIPQLNLESAAPVSVVSTQDIKLSGTTRIEDVLNSLPSVASSQSAGLSNGATGTAEVDLRYLGSKRTLVLVNGRRLGPGDPNSTTQAADLNMIPSSIIKRAELLTGGASSTYGADAVAGVVNFVMDTDFEGIRLDGQYGFYWHKQQDPSITGGRTITDALNDRIDQGLVGYDYPTGSTTDGKSIDLTASIGAGFDDGRGHALAYFGYRKVNDVTLADRDFSVCQLGGTEEPFCAGSLTAAPGHFFAFTEASGGISTTFTFGPNRTVVEGRGPLFNYNPYNYFQRPDERYVGGAFANYEINDQIKPYLEFMFMDDHTLAQIAPSGDFGNTFVINCDNPLMSPEANAAVCNPDNLIAGFIGSFPVAAGAAFNPNPGSPPIDFFDPLTGNTYNKAYFNLLRRNVEGGGRVSDLTHTSYRGVVGTKGDLDAAWSYDAYYQYGQTNYTQVYRNEFSAARLNKALDAVDDPRTATVGDAVCRSVLDNSDPLCVPYDIFSSPSAAALEYLNIFGVIEGKTHESIANLNFTGTLGEYGMQLPWAHDGIGVNAGVEYRNETLVLNPDELFQAGDLTGQGAPTLAVDGTFDVWEVFAEAQLPIVQDSFIDELTLTAGYRKSWYHTKSEPIGEEADREYDTDTYKIGLELAPISDVRFRAAYNRAVRAPNIQELFAPQFVGLDGGTDPCAGHVIAADEFGCLAQGMVVGQSTPLNPAAQYNGLLGGNPQLNPEKATTKTIGVVLQPRFLPRFAATIDYWNIKVDGAIQGFGADTILADCVANSTASAAAPSCALVNRNPAGSIWLSPDGFVIDTPTNVGGIKTSGWDFNWSYSHQLGNLGGLSASFLGTYLDKYVTDNGIAAPYDCAGFYGTICSSGTVASAAPMPHWRHKLRTTWAAPHGIGVSLQWRMVGKVKNQGLSDDDALAGPVPQLGGRIPAQHYFDLALTYALGDSYNFRAGINNIFDNDPPLISRDGGSCPAGPCNNATYPGAWDSLGRFVYLGATLDF
jgi:outer membrane receptor protein involved in Fe transport